MCVRLPSYAPRVSEPAAEPLERNERIDYLNSAFYMGDPSAYLRTRLHMVLLVAARSNELEQLGNEGLTFEGVTISPISADDEPEADPERLDTYVTTEVVLLQHHAAEAVLRNYVAHATQPGLPWVDLADRRKFWEFKRLIRDKLVDGLPDRAEIGKVCLGNRSAPDDHDKDSWEAAIDGLAAFLRSMALTFLDDAPVYNALKHGLSLDSPCR